MRRWQNTAGSHRRHGAECGQTSASGSPVSHRGRDGWRLLCRFQLMSLAIRAVPIIERLALRGVSDHGPRSDKIDVMTTRTICRLRALDAGALAQTVQQYGAAAAQGATLGRNHFGCEGRSQALTDVRLSIDLEIVSVLGEGGMGVVHLARQRPLGREVAVKTGRQDAPLDANTALANEAVLTGSLEHPAIVPVHAFGRAADGRPVMVMKRLDIMLTECRFACHQALAEWPENSAAQNGARRCLEALIELELHEGHASAARALLGDLPSGSSALFSQLDELERRLESERAEAERLRLFARDLDPGLGHRTRRSAVLWFAGFAGSVSVAVLVATRTGELNPERVAQVGAANVIVGCAIASALWRRLSRNAFGRKLTMVALISSVFMLVQRLVAARAGLPAHVTLTIDCLQLTLALIIGGLTLAPFLLRSAAIMGLGFGLQVLWPARAPAIFSVSVVAMLVVLGIFWRPPSES